MIELPEALTIARQINEAVAGKTVARVLPPTKPHKFCWFNGDAAEYESQLQGATLLSAEGFGIYAEMSFDNGKKLAINDGVNLRLSDGSPAPRSYQLLIEFTDGMALVFTVAMYGGIVLHGGDYDNEYYRKSRGYISPFAPEFESLYRHALAAYKPTMSAKAFLATQQRFPGIGNGVSQDILLAAGIHPKRKLQTLDSAAQDKLLKSMVSVLSDMVEGGGRDTEKDIFGNPGGYITRMSNKTLDTGCPACGGPITKETYLGGSVYYCANCQPLAEPR
ncbi:MAG: endonuclease VIII [Syntrophomonadaceae bacterium]|nr:endonuclease VIII [Syntrophomonadaceae bacterium]